MNAVLEVVANTLFQKPLTMLPGSNLLFTQCDVGPELSRNEVSNRLVN
jgi:hypothetical protein